MSLLISWDRIACGSKEMRSLHSLMFLLGWKKGEEREVIKWRFEQLDRHLLEGIREFVGEYPEIRQRLLVLHLLGVTAREVSL
jgi:hypothetical protein